MQHNGTIRVQRQRVGRPFGVRVRLLCLLIALVVAGLTPYASRMVKAATTWTVTDNSDSVSDTGSLRYALTNAQDGDTITFDPNYFSGGGTIAVSASLDVVSNVTITGPGANLLTIDASGAVLTAGVLYISGGVTASISGLTIADGNNTGNSSTRTGGGIENHGTLALTNTTVRTNQAPSGGGIYNGGRMTLTNVAVRGNNADASGGGIYNGGWLTVTNSSVSGNSAYGGSSGSGGGGGIYNDGLLTVAGSSVDTNTVGDGPGGGILSSEPLIITNSTVNGNEANGGGGISSSGQTTVTGSTISGNTSDQGLDGGGFSGTGTISNSTISGNNTCGGNGAGINGTITLINSTVSGNTAGYGSLGPCGGSGAGGGISGGGTVVNSTISGNSAWYGGGGIYNESGFKVLNSTLSGNGASSEGGIYSINVSTLTIANSIVAGNTPDDIPGYTAPTPNTNIVGLTVGGTTYTLGQILAVQANGTTPLLANNGGPTQTIALVANSPAIGLGQNCVDASGAPLTTDQRAYTRPNAPTSCDAGAFELAGVAATATSTPTPASSTATPAPSTPAATMASVVYGQPDFTSTILNNGGVSATSLDTPEGVAADGNGGLFVADTSNNRVLHYPPGSTTADAVYGQPGFASQQGHLGGVSARSLYRPSEIAVDGDGGLYVADTSNNRVLHFPKGSAIADVVYGQPNFTSNAANNGGLSASSLNNPGVVVVDASGGLYVTDGGNGRVLHYAKGSTIADAVYGQPNFTSNTQVNGGVSAAGPMGAVVAIDANGGLYTDGGFRVLHFSPGSTIADVVYGQPDFTSTAPNTGGVSASSLNGVGGLALDASGGLYIADNGNNRVLHYPPGSTTADVVYGQPDFTSNAGWASAINLYGPMGVAVDGNGGLYVADSNNNRVLYFPPSGSVNTATPVGTSTATPIGTATDTPTAIVTDTPTVTNQGVTIQLTAGWNLIALGVAPSAPVDAQTVLTTLIGKTGGGYVEIDSYSNGQFSPSLYDDPADGLGIIGTDFTLQMGHGYALYTDNAGSLTFSSSGVS